MRKHLKNKKGFTLIELLVVIAIIALLLAIIVPSLRKAKEYAKKLLCKSNLHQIALAIGNYETAYNINFRNTAKWYFDNGTGDMPWEAGTATVPDQTKMMRDIVGTGMLPNHEAFFCPGAANVSYDKNYRRDLVSNGNVENYDMLYFERQIENKTFDPSRGPALWSTYIWLWRKRLPDPLPVKDGSGITVTSSAVTVNNLSKEALMCDVTTQTWGYAKAINNQDSQIIANLEGAGRKIKQAIPHFHVLMSDYSILNPTDKDTELNPEATQWLWNSTTWAGRGISSGGY